MGTLYLLPVNGETSFRARRALRDAALIVGECKLIRNLEVHPPPPCTDERTIGDEPERVIEALEHGDVVWLVDVRETMVATMPTQVRDLVERGIAVSPLPTGDRLTAVLAASGLPLNRFTFLGTIDADGQQSAWQNLIEEKGTVACVVKACELEAIVTAIEATLGKCESALWDGTHIWRGHLGDPLPSPAGTRCLLIVHRTAQSDRWPAEQVRTAVRQALATGTSPRDAARDIAARSGWSHREVYRIILEEKPTGPSTGNLRGRDTTGGEDGH